jgi:hypothetical protein
MFTFILNCYLCSLEKQLYISRFFKSFLVWGLLLQMINLSVDPARHLNIVGGKYTISEDLSINKMESVYELVLEYVFKIEVPETQDAEEEVLQKTGLTYCLVDKVNIDLKVPVGPVRHNHRYTESIPEHIPALHSPPPKAKV